MIKDDLGARMKKYEDTSVFSKDLPLMVRIDGRSFSKFTRSFKKPFDSNINYAMKQTTINLMNATNAHAAYYQSDELTLFYPILENPLSEREFGGKKFKIVSNYASLATAYFNNALQHPKNKLATFDCRAFHVPTNFEVINNFIWRMQDARKNSVSSIYRFHYGHKKMQRLSSTGMKNELGQIYDNYEPRYKYGEFFVKGQNIKTIDIEVFLDYSFEDKYEYIFQKDIKDEGSN